MELLKEFTTNCNENVNQLRELFKAYDLAKLGYDIQEEQVKAVYNSVLANGCYRASEDFDGRGCNIRKGDRITREEDMYFLGDEEWERLMTATTAELAKAGITDEEGRYLTDWVRIKGDAHRALIGFIFDKLLPLDMQIKLTGARGNIVWENKILDVFRSMAETA